jgi:hypothetical protein
MRAGWARIDATPVAQGVPPPKGLKIVGGCNALREPLLLAIASGRTGQGGGEEVAIDVAPGLDEGDSATSHLSLFLQESR